MIVALTIGCHPSLMKSNACFNVVNENLSATILALAECIDGPVRQWPDEMREIVSLLTRAQERLTALSLGSTAPAY